MMVSEKYFHVGLVNTSFTNANTIVFVSLFLCSPSQKSLQICGALQCAELSDQKSILIDPY